MLELWVGSRGFEDYSARTWQRGVQRLAFFVREVRILRTPHYDRKGVEDLADFRTDVRLIARDRIYHVGLGRKVAAQLLHHSLVDELRHRWQIEKARFDLRANRVGRRRQHPLAKFFSAARTDQPARYQHHPLDFVRMIDGVVERDVSAEIVANQVDVIEDR